MSDYACCIVVASPVLRDALCQAVAAYGLENRIEVSEIRPAGGALLLDLGKNGAPSGPFRLGALLDRALGMDNQRKDAPVKIGPYLFSQAENILKTEKPAEDIRLTYREGEILGALAAAPDHFIEKEDLLETIWGYAAGLDTHTLETHIYRLRQKIEADPATPALLITQGSGYRLVTDSD